MLFYLLFSSNVFFKELYALAEKMVTGVAAVDAVVAVGVHQLAEILALLYKFLGVFGSVAEMHIVVGKSVAQKQRAVKTGSPADWTVVVAGRILGRRTHEPFGIDCVVVTP